MLIRDLNELNLLLVQNLERIRAIPFDVVVHIPRSGTIPASILATSLCKPMCSVEEFCRNIVSTRKSERMKTLHRILLVDDSLRTGTQMRKNHDIIAAARPEAQIHSLAVFRTILPEGECIYEPTMTLAQHEDFPYFYPWFMWKSKRIISAAVDMDGVLCGECPRESDDDGEKYLEFLATAPPKYLTRFKIGAVVTSRLSKYRKETQHWLAKWGINYEALHMGPWSSIAERRGNQAQYKGDIYKNLSNLDIFIESSVKEAPDIAAVSGKKVWCVDNQRSY